MVADPLRLLHCCPISDGAAAVVLTRRARAPCASPGIGQGTDTLAVRHRPSSRASAPPRWPRAAAYAMAGFGPERVDFAEVHDAFAPVRADLARGHRARAARQGGPRHARRRDRARRPTARSIPPAGSRRAAIRWRRPGSPRSWSASGSSRGRAGARQLSGRVALAHSIGGLATNNWVTLLEADDDRDHRRLALPALRAGGGAAAPRTARIIPWP